MEPAKSKIFRSGSGMFAALLVILLFILAATFLKTLVFGIIAAYFLLPLEKFFERRVFRTRVAETVFRFLSIPMIPFSALRNRLMHSVLKTPEELEKRKRESLVLKSTIAAFLSCILVLLAVFMITASILLPAAADAGRSINRWASESQSLKEAETKVSRWLDSPESGQKGISAGRENKQRTLRDILTTLRPQIEMFLKENRADVLAFAFSKGKGLLSSLVSLVSFLGTFAFDLLLFLFFLLFFLQKMAVYSDPEGKSNLGEWCIQGIFNTAWLPETTSKARDEAAEIINTIGNMFQCWVRGYISIILIETVCYLTLFFVFSVPYALPLAIAAGLTILLPFIGPVSSFMLTAAICLIFCESHLIITLIGVSIAYLLINGILEQLILYPTFVGGAIGLNLLETIIVVLLGGLAAGITGMILAVPAAAILKYLVPKLYELRKRE